MNEFLDGNPIPVESSDDAVLRMLGGAYFGPNAKLILPSGTELDGREAQVFSSLYAAELKPADVPNRNPEVEGVSPLRYEDNPLSSEFDDWTEDPIENSRRLVQRAYDAIDISTHQEARRSLNYEDLSSLKGLKVHKKKSNWLKRLLGR